MPSKPNRKALSAEDWVQSALNAIADGGIGAVAIERLARSLDVTKGSFYWHFSGRDALLRAAVERWEQEHTEAVIAWAEAEADPGQRIQRLFRGARAGRRAGKIYLAFSAAGADPVVGPVIERVNQRRLGFMVENYRALGLGDSEARHRALLAYSVYLGIMQMRRDSPGMIPSGPAYEAYLEYISRTLIPDAGSTGR